MGWVNKAPEPLSQMALLPPPPPPRPAAEGPQPTADGLWFLCHPLEFQQSPFIRHSTLLLGAAATAISQSPLVSKINGV